MKFSEELMNAMRHVRGLYPSPDLSDRGVLLNNLLFVWHLMRASEHLLEVAAEKSEGRDKEYFLEHLEEERNHHEWLTADLKHAGIDPYESFIPVEAVNIVGAQYYFIFHINPHALFGYMAYTECFPTPMEVIEELEHIHGKELLKTIRYHATHDVDHGREMLEMIDSLPEASRSIIFQNAVQTAHNYGAATLKFNGGRHGRVD